MLGLKGLGVSVTFSGMEGFLTALQSLKAVTDIVKSLKNNSSEIKAQKDLLEVYSSLLELKVELIVMRDQYAELSDIKRELERKLSDHDHWEQTKSRYELHQIEPGIFVYALKPEFKGDEPLHYLCPSCMEKGQKGILSKTSPRSYEYKCPMCKWSFSTYHGGRGSFQAEVP